MSVESKYILGANRGPLLTSEGGAVGLEKVESAGGLSLTRTPTRTQKLRRHWKRFWLIYCIGNVIFLAIFLPIFFLICIPAIAQLVVNKSDLWLTQAIVNSPKPDSVILTLTTNVDLKLAVPARIEDLPLKLFERVYGTGDAYAQITIPGQTIKGNHSMGVSEQFTPLGNMTAWNMFVHQVVFQEETSLALSGSTNAYLGVLKSHVHLNKNIKSPTLNKFKGFAISDATLLLPADSDGTNLIGNTTLPNPTVLQLEVGTLNLDIKAGDIVLGNVSIHDVTLVPGDNTFPLKGILDIKEVIKNLGDVLTAEASAIKHGNLSITAVTSSVIFDGTLVPYYTDILKELELTAEIGIGDVLKNTLRHLGSSSNDTSGVLSNLTDGLNLSSLKAHDVDKRDTQAPVDLSSFLKGNQHVQDLLQDVEPDDRDSFIDWVASSYPDT